MSADADKIDAAALEKIRAEIKNLSNTLDIVANIHKAISQSNYPGSAAPFIADGLAWLTNMHNVLTSKKETFEGLLPESERTHAAKPQEGTSAPGTPPVVGAETLPAQPATPSPQWSQSGPPQEIK